MDRAIRVGDIAITERAEEAHQLVLNVGMIQRDIPGVVGPPPAGADFVGRWRSAL